MLREHSRCFCWSVCGVENRFIQLQALSCDHSPQLSLGWEQDPRISRTTCISTGPRGAKLPQCLTSTGPHLRGTSFLQPQPVSWPETPVKVFRPRFPPPHRNPRAPQLGTSRAPHAAPLSPSPWFLGCKLLPVHPGMT